MVVQARRPQPRHSAATSMAGLRSLGGGEIREYTSLLWGHRRQALDRLVSERDAAWRRTPSLSMRFDSSELSGTMSEIVAYGTAVVVAPGAAATPMGGPVAAAVE